MTSPRNEALKWLVDALQDAQPTVLVTRNEPQPENMGRGAAILLNDSADGADYDREDMIGMGTPSYSFQVGVDVDIYVETASHGDRTDRLFELAQSVGNVISGDRTLGGNIAFADLSSSGQNHEVLTKGATAMGALRCKLLLVYDLAGDPIG
jgi:hypothetical protein